MVSTDSEEELDVEVIEKKKICLDKLINYFHIKMNSKRNDANLCRSIFLLYDDHGNVVNDVCLLQYHIADGSDTVCFTVKPHGNRKYGSRPYQPTQKSTLNRIRDKISQNQSAGIIYNDLIRENGGPLENKAGSLPCSRQQIYDMKSMQTSAVDKVEELLSYAQKSDHQIVLDHKDIPEDLWVLGTKEMCTDLSRFSICDLKSHPFSVDPTFKFGDYDVTPFMYKHLLLRSIHGSQEPIFLGPTAIHHGKNEATYRHICQVVVNNCKGIDKIQRFYHRRGSSSTK